MKRSEIKQLNERRLQQRGISADDVDAVVDDLPDTQLQVYLDELSVTLAKQHANTLREMVSERSNLEYIGLESLTAVYNRSLSVDISQWRSNSAKYTTKHFHATAKVYSIIPSNVTYDMGFIQTCESRTQVQTYTDDGVNTRWELAGGFPKSDSSSNNDIPWYYVGVGFACSNYTARRGFSPQNQETFELDDNFNNIGTSVTMDYRKSSSSLRTTLKNIKRKQAFKFWFAVKRASSNVYRLLREGTYGFDFQLNFTPNSNTVTSTSSDQLVNIAVSVPDLDAELPRHALNGPTTNGADQLNLYMGDTFQRRIV